MDSENRPIPVNISFISYEPKITSNKPPVVFIHGTMSSPNCWNKVKEKICDKTGRKGYAICLRNHGTSEWSDEMSVIDMAADVKNFMWKERISKAVLIGHSLGGRVVLAIALENPEQIEKIIVEDMKLSIEDNVCQFLGFKSILEKAVSNLDAFPSSVSEKEAQMEISPSFTFSWCKKPTWKARTKPLNPFLPFYRDRSGKFVWEINIDALLNMFGSMPKLEIPFQEDTVFLGEALFIAAEYSVFDVMEQTDLIKKHFPNSQFMLAKDVYHCCHLEKPEEFMDTVIKFLTPDNV